VIQHGEKMATLSLEKAIDAMLSEKLMVIELFQSEIHLYDVGIGGSYARD